MSHYVLIESGSPLESRDRLSLLDLAKELSEDGHEVDVFLVANGTLLLLDGFASELASLSSRVTFWSDELSFSTRTPASSALPSWVRAGDMDDLVRLVMRPGTTPIWH